MEEIFQAIHKEWGAKKVEADFVLGVKRTLQHDPQSGEMIGVELTMAAFVDGMVTAFEEHLDDDKVTEPFPTNIKMSRFGFSKGLVSDCEREVPTHRQTLTLGHGRLPIDAAVPQLLCNYAMTP